MSVEDSDQSARSEAHDADDLHAVLGPLRQCLTRVRAPDGLYERLLTALPADSNDAPAAPAHPARNVRWRSALAIAAALAAVIGLWVFDDERAGRAAPGAQPNFVVERKALPLRAHSISGGPTIRVVDASIVKDRRGLIRAIYVHQMVRAPVQAGGDQRPEVRTQRSPK